jgi:hypothetical protein
MSKVMALATLGIMAALILAVLGFCVLGFALEFRATRRGNELKRSAGGSPRNMQWQTTAEAKAMDQVE